MRTLSILMVPLALCGASPTLAMTMSSFPSRIAALRTSTVLDTAPGVQRPLSLVADLQNGAAVKAESAAGVSAQVRSLASTDAAPQTASLSLPPEAIAARSDLGGPRSALPQPTGASSTTATTIAALGRTTSSSEVFAATSLPPVVDHEGTVSVAGDTSMMSPSDSMAPVRQTQLASLDVAYVPTAPDPIVAPDAPVTPSIVRRKPEERLIDSASKTASIRKALSPKIVRPALASTALQPFARPHVARVKLMRPAMEASTSVPEAAQIAGLRAMERMP